MRLGTTICLSSQYVHQTKRSLSEHQLNSLSLQHLKLVLGKKTPLEPHDNYLPGTAEGGKSSIICELVHSRDVEY
ncbi:hypothetical protein E2C01_002170 [Portunus trituberculatus]|uniref:Uncharacterized protein n=1 Tax=Portunus trituberculatus TaxID=210409 RepID=A0A5B7CJV2_PORTR|nr:hypothetical protein [Portunus trituberculatus]